MDIGPELPPHLRKKTTERVEAKNEISDDDYIGPALPPHLRKHTESKTSDVTGASTVDAGNIEPEAIGPALPPHLIKAVQHIESGCDGIGPVLPPHLTAKSHNENVEENDGTFGPALPPTMKKENKILGPQLPPGFTSQAEEESDEDVVGPLLPPDLSEEDQQFLIVRDFEKRSERMKDKLSGKLNHEKVEREEWMTELPPVFQGFGMGPRQFRARPKEIGDRTGWTDTPADKLKKAKESSIIKAEEIDPSLQRIKERDAHISKQIKERENEEESLLALHEKSRKRKLKEDKASGKGDVRRPFDRDIDLQANRFDEAAKKRMLKQGAGLSSRFAHGETSATFL